MRFLFIAILLIPAAAAALPVSFPGIESVHVRTRPEPGSLDILEHKALSLALNADDDELLKVISMMPKRFRLVNGKHIQPAVDALVLEILDTETGLRSFCPFSVFSSEQLRRYLGISRDAADTIALRCVRHGSRLAEIDEVRKMAVVEPKVWIFLFGEEEPNTAESYTSRYNVSYIVAGPKQPFSRERFVRAMAHELAVSYDQLSRLADLGQPGEWQQGLEVALARTGEKMPAFEPVTELHEMKCALRNPAIRYALAAERAYAFEDRIIRELGWLPTSPPMSSSGFCTNMIRRNMVALTNFGLLAPSGKVYRRLCGPLTRETLDKQIAFIEFMILNFAHRPMARSLCQFMTEPHVGPFVQPFDAPVARPAMGRP